MIFQKLSKAEKKIFDDVNNTGWHIINVLEEENHPPHSYSIGLYQTFKHPEIIIVGVNNIDAQNIINDIAVRIKKGEKFEGNRYYSDLLEKDYKCYFIEVDKIHYQNYVGFGMWFYKRAEFPLLQCILPAMDNTYPWYNNYPDHLRKKQILLGKIK